MVSEEDFAELSQHTWYNTKGYAYRAVYIPAIKNNRMVAMHREIMGTPNGMDTDHINGNTLDNRRENLRVCTHAENSMNTKKSRSALYSKFKGVTYNKRARLFMVQIKFLGKRVYCKYFKTEIEAAKAYNENAPKFFGEYAKINPLPNEVVI